VPRPDGWRDVPPPPPRPPASAPPGPTPHQSQPRPVARGCAGSARPVRQRPVRDLVPPEARGPERLLGREVPVRRLVGVGRRQRARAATRAASGPSPARRSARYALTWSGLRGKRRVDRGPASRRPTRPASRRFRSKRHVLEPPGRPAPPPPAAGGPLRRMAPVQHREHVAPPRSASRNDTRVKPGLPANRPAGAGPTSSGFASVVTSTSFRHPEAGRDLSQDGREVGGRPAASASRRRRNHRSDRPPPIGRASAAARPHLGPAGGLGEGRSARAGLHDIGVEVAVAAPRRAVGDGGRRRQAAPPPQACRASTTRPPMPVVPRTPAAQRATDSPRLPARRARGTRSASDAARSSSRSTSRWVTVAVIDHREPSTRVSADRPRRGGGSPRSSTVSRSTNRPLPEHGPTPPRRGRDRPRRPPPTTACSTRSRTATSSRVRDDGQIRRGGRDACPQASDQHPEDVRARTDNARARDRRGALLLRGATRSSTWSKEARPCWPARSTVPRFDTVFPRPPDARRRPGRWTTRRDLPRAQAVHPRT